ncbi:hypothetical protein ISN44_As04g021440 [Arabidopsis suecica]|uniref:DUF1204 domain-containing protein n=1 Tax=Arabidopsis suecica TaxID=45249 RepID=A0A8T2ECV6_ARASU|nr:hypothetical protein ISN44_As04g021440 [Arabidopsis suecica]
MSGKYNNLVERAFSGRKELRERRLEYDDFVQMSAVDKMAELIEKRLDRIKTYIDNTKSSKEDDDHADGRDGQEGRVGERIIDQVVVQDETTGGEKIFGSVGWSMSTLFEGRRLIRWRSSSSGEVEIKSNEMMSGLDANVELLKAESSKEDDDHADGRDGQEGRVGERIIDQVVLQDETTGVDG